MTGTGEDILLVDDHGPIRLLTLNRPRALNALSGQLGQELGAAIREADADPGIRVTVVTGAGSRAFCAGADLKEMVGRGPSMGDDGRIVTRALRARPAKPFLTAVNGLAYGAGLELVLACDLAVCSEQATFALPEVQRGILASGGGLVRLPHVVGPRRALQLTLTGQAIDAPTALSWGLVNLVVPVDGVVDQTLALARVIAANAPLAVAASKHAIVNGARLAEDDAWTLNDGAFRQVKDSSDALEGPRAFAEKRRPQWTGR